VEKIDYWKAFQGHEHERARQAMGYCILGRIINTHDDKDWSSQQKELVDALISW